jgi:uncharacterized cupredoxin-like copper-binding protein
MRSRLPICAYAALGLMLAVGQATASEPAKVNVQLWDKPDGTMGMTLSKEKIKAGPVEFTVKNASKDMMHEFLLVPDKGDVHGLAYDSKEQQVAEDKLRGLKGVEDMKPGQETTIRLVLAAGDYAVFCNQPGHYKHGMARRLVVR